MKKKAPKPHSQNIIDIERITKIVGLIAAIIGIVGQFSPQWRFTGCLLIIIGVCIFLMIPRGTRSRDSSKKVRPIALNGIVAISFFWVGALLSNFMVIVPLHAPQSTALTLTPTVTAIAYPLTPTLTTIPIFTPIPTLNVYRTYEWQWAGENWYGRITFENRNDQNIITQVRVGLIEKTLEDRVLMGGMVLQLVPNTTGTFEIVNGGIELEIIVQKKNRRTGQIDNDTIKGFLTEVPCYAGRVTYSGDGVYEGDMILVGYESQLGFNVNDWFRNENEQEWFDHYLLDR